MLGRNPAIAGRILECLLPILIHLLLPQTPYPIPIPSRLVCPQLSPPPLAIVKNRGDKRCSRVPSETHKKHRGPVSESTQAHRVDLVTPLPCLSRALHRFLEHPFSVINLEALALI
ncbi:hypothetical protein LZ30DRAFT_212628 [Colletotrichum cereale]|nr:hypothetical protein LZ30DRAFT_212628 [Colletotrichum cereale]